ncbi:DUF2971 domain-containing protein [Variovorax sp. GT1P44]|uniref:DUF2971 domain-containing protein n=1 Tax=Variovorax sp. GT1P44 TaxID=3443742 RepID=UPI003F461D39
MAIGREDVPHRLYKYFAPDRVNALDDAMLRYTPLCAFNDPFEGRPDISQLTPPDEVISSLNPESLASALRSNYDQLDDATKSTIPYETFVQLFDAALNGAGGEVAAALSVIWVGMKRRFLSSMDSFVGALCLTEEPTNILMWPHYAQSHEGFAIEFDAHHDYFHSQRYPEDEFYRLRRVAYRRDRPNFDFKDVNGIIVFLVKSADWAYENEWRVLRPLAEADRRIDISPYPIDLFSFPRDTVKSVILGARATPKTLAGVRDVLGSHGEYRGVRVRQAMPDPTTFRLIIKDLPST